MAIGKFTINNNLKGKIFYQFCDLIEEGLITFEKIDKYKTNVLIDWSGINRYQNKYNAENTGSINPIKSLKYFLKMYNRKESKYKDKKER